jgi:hypothetical protein
MSDGLAGLRIDRYRELHPSSYQMEHARQPYICRLRVGWLHTDEVRGLGAGAARSDVGRLVSMRRRVACFSQEHFMAAQMKSDRCIDVAVDRPWMGDAC